MSDAVALTSLSGFDNLGESARASIAYNLGLPKAALRGRSSEQIQSAHSSAVRLNEGATVEIFGMRGRTDLNGQSATLLTFQPSKEGNGNGGRQQDDRWACRIAGTGEQVRVRVGSLAPANLAPWWGEEEEEEEEEEEGDDEDDVEEEVANGVSSMEVAQVA